MNDFALQPTQAQPLSPASVAAAEREKHHLQSAMMFAAARPRNEQDARVKILAVCKRPRFASGAIYSFTKGKKIEGATVKLARELARVWGNIDAGFRVMDRSKKECHLQGYAVDLETNVWQRQEDRFELLVKRRKKGGDESELVPAVDRDARELIGNRGAKLERNCILRLIPMDIVEEAMDECRKTSRLCTEGKLEAPRDVVLTSVLVAWSEIGVDREAIERRLGNTLDEADDEQLAGLCELFGKIKAGEVRRLEAFPPAGHAAVAAARSQERPGRRVSGQK